MSEDFLKKFKCAFQDECRNENEYIALPTYKRTYYLVYHYNRLEALFGINFNKNQNPVVSYSISSFARIIEKDKDAAPGCWYLKEIIEKVLLPTCHKEEVNIISARLKCRGGKKAFEELAEITSADADYIIDVEEYSGKITVK